MYFVVNILLYFFIRPIPYVFYGSAMWSVKKKISLKYCEMIHKLELTILRQLVATACVRCTSSSLDRFGNRVRLHAAGIGQPSSRSVFVPEAVAFSPEHICSLPPRDSRLQSTKP